MVLCGVCGGKLVRILWLGGLLVCLMCLLCCWLVFMWCFCSVGICCCGCVCFLIIWSICMSGLVIGVNRWGWCVFVCFWYEGEFVGGVVGVILYIIIVRGMCVVLWLVWLELWCVVCDWWRRVWCFGIFLF